MNVVLIVPTGLGAEIGGFAGDANPVAKLLGACCENLITHPNVVNASDINEMPDNCLYVEGAMLDDFLKGEIKLKKVLQNKILLVVNKPVTTDTINSVSAARCTLGANIKIAELETPLLMTSGVTYRHSEKAGSVSGWKELVNQVSKDNYTFDALAIQTAIAVDQDAAMRYLERGGINPWGKVEAMCSRLVSNQINKPVAHAPLDSGLFEGVNITTDPRIAAEMVSVSYLHCVLKGLHYAPQPSRTEGLSINDVDVLVSPYGCLGLPHDECFRRDITVIAVIENAVFTENCDARTVLVRNYWEAAGYLMAMKARIDPMSVRRPLSDTVINPVIK